MTVLTLRNECNLVISIFLCKHRHLFGDDSIIYMQGESTYRRFSFDMEGILGNI